MSSNENEFREWMDSKGLSAADVAGPLHVEEQTVRHWRSKGVPERRQAHVNYFMSTWHGKAADPEVPAITGQNLVVHPSREQFRTWNLAAIDERLPIDEWAIKGLDRLAAEWQEQQQLQQRHAAEEDTTYGAPDKRKPA